MFVLKVTFLYAYNFVVNPDSRVIIQCSNIYALHIEMVRLAEKLKV